MLIFVSMIIHNILLCYAKPFVSREVNASIFNRVLAIFAIKEIERNLDVNKWVCCFFAPFAKEKIRNLALLVEIIFLICCMY